MAPGKSDTSQRRASQGYELRGRPVLLSNSTNCAQVLESKKFLLAGVTLGYDAKCLALRLEVPGCLQRFRIEKVRFILDVGTLDIK